MIQSWYGVQFLSDSFKPSSSANIQLRELRNASKLTELYDAAHHLGRYVGKIGSIDIKWDSQVNLSDSLKSSELSQYIIEKVTTMSANSGSTSLGEAYSKIGSIDPYWQNHLHKLDPFTTSMRHLITDYLYQHNLQAVSFEGGVEFVYHKNLTED